MSEANQVAYSFTAANDATEYTIPQWIIQDTDIAIYFGTTLQSRSTYTITNITTTGYTLTFSTAPTNGTVVFIFRAIDITQPAEFTPGQKIDANDLNTINNRFYLQAIDSDYRLENLGMRYKETLLATSGTVTTAMMEFPVPTSPGTGESNYVMAWDGTQWVSEQKSDGGITAAELETQLALATSSDSGAEDIGYYITFAVTGHTANSPQNLKAMLDTVMKTVITATSFSTSGAKNIPIWDTSDSGSASDVQTMFYDLYKDATSDSVGKIENIKFWDRSRSVSQELYTAIMNLYGNASASSPGYGAGQLTYYNEKTTTTQKTNVALNNRREYGVGDYIAGVPVYRPGANNGDWLVVESSQSIGSAASSATFKSDSYLALYKYLAVNYDGQTESAAETAFNANTVLTPSTMSNPISGKNTYRWQVT